MRWFKRIEELDGAEAGFARVAARGSGVCLRLGGGVRLEIEPGFDEATLRLLLAKGFKGFIDADAYKGATATCFSRTGYSSAPAGCTCGANSSTTPG